MFISDLIYRQFHDIQVVVQQVSALPLAQANQLVPVRRLQVLDVIVLLEID